jgi:GNAT superfamily N-acetyltransferase
MPLTSAGGVDSTTPVANAGWKNSARAVCRGMRFSIHPLRVEDEPAWAPLWQGYLGFYETPLAPAVSAKTWARLLNPAEPVHGWGAFDEAGSMLGFTIAICHRSTWSISDYLYLEDLFTAPAARGRGVARALVEAVCEFARAQGAPRVYWHTQESNASAQALYDKIAGRSGFIVYRLAP